MMPNATIEDWSDEHDSAVGNVLKISAINYRLLYEADFPSDAMVIGENWLYIAEIKNLRGQNAPLDKNAAIDFSKGVIINWRWSGRTARYLHLGQILDDLKEHLPTDEMALLPVTQKRQDEVRTLGYEHKDHDDWYTIQRENGKRIKVFPLLPDTKTIYLGNTPDGSRVGYTPMQRKPPIGNI